MRTSVGRQSGCATTTTTTTTTTTRLLTLSAVSAKRIDLLMCNSSTRPDKGTSPHQEQRCFCKAYILMCNSSTCPDKSTSPHQQQRRLCKACLLKRNIVALCTPKTKLTPFERRWINCQGLSLKTTVSRWCIQTK